MADTTTFKTRYYKQFGLVDSAPDRYFRIGSSGYDRWDPDAHDWIPITSKAAQDSYSRAIENGDNAFPAKPEEIARLS